MTWIGWLAPDDSGRVNAVWAALAVLGDEDDMEERIERAWLARVAPYNGHRRRFADGILRQYPLTQPKDICQRCNGWTGDWDEAWELDHMVELVYGGQDDPTNLVRLCECCHREKPLPPGETRGDPEAMRRFVIDWIRRGPPGGRRPVHVPTGTSDA